MESARRRVIMMWVPNTRGEQKKKYSISSDKLGGGAVWGPEVVKRLRVRDRVPRIKGSNVELSTSVTDYM